MDKEQSDHTNKLAKINKTSLIVNIILLIVVAALVVVFLWYIFMPQDEDTSSTPPSVSNESAGACGGEENVAPDGFTFYENEDLGFKFAYPQEWGDVSVATDPQGGSAGNYLMGNFSENDDVWFGGNATDYVVGARGGMPTDNPGYLIANGQFYDVEIMKADDTGGQEQPEDRHELHPITQPSELKDGCNTDALLTQYPETQLHGYSYDAAQFNLQSDNLYYGVNVILRNPDEASRAQLDQLISTFELIP